MNLLQKLRYIPDPHLAESKDYLARIVANGGSIRMESLLSCDRFIRSCMAAGIWTKLTEVYPLCGNDISSALVKLKYNTTPLLTSVNFAPSDFTERGANGGIAGDGATKYLNANYDISRFNTTNMHMSVWLREDELSGPKYWFASFSASDNAGIGTPSGTTQQAYMGGTTANAVNADFATKGWYLVQRDATTNLILCKDGAQVASSSTSFASGMASQPLYLCARYNSGAAQSHTAKRISFATVGQALTPTERTALFNAATALQTALERN
jgi:hypothetical protein